MDVNNPVLIELAVVLAIATGLHVALGPIIARLVEAFKPTGLVPSNYGGLFAVAISGLIGGILGLLAYLAPNMEAADWRYIVYGVIAGVLGPGSGAVTSAQVRTGIEASKAERATTVESTTVDIDQDAGGEIAAVQVTKAVGQDPLDHQTSMATFMAAHDDTGDSSKSGGPWDPQQTEAVDEDTPYNWWRDDVKRAEMQIGADQVEDTVDHPDAGQIPASRSLTIFTA